MARKTPGTHSQLVHCSACGEDYASTYKRCPFCGDKHAQPQIPVVEDDYVFEGGYIFDELDAEKGKPVQQPQGGKRLASGQKKPVKRTSIWKRLNISPVRVIGFIFTLLIIIGAFMIVSKVVLPMISRGSVDVPPSQPNTGHSQTADPTPDQTPDVVPTEDPDESTPPSVEPVETQTPEPTETIPADQTATGLTLSHSEFSISDKYPSPVKIKATLSPAGSTATITWTSSNPSVITVDQNGLVTAIGKGNATITASIPGGAEATCYVRSTLSGSSSSEGSSGSSSESSPAPSTPSNLSLNRDDFTLSDTYPTFTIKASGASGSVTWSSSDTSVATVDSNGKVTKVGTGKCTVTATDESGTSVKCIVRCG